MKTVLLQAVAALLMLLLLLNGLMYLQQPSLTFFPDKPLQQTPASWRLSYDDVRLTAANGEQLHGWYIPRNGARQTVLFFHGNGGNISHRGESIEIFHRLGLNVFIIDYRGYGQSAGTPDEAGMYEDARLAWDYLTRTKGLSPYDIILFGRSLGGAVAAHLASEVHAGALILESTFSSVRDMAQAAYPILSRLVWLRYRFSTADYLAGVHCPVLVLHSPQDDIIPYRFGRQVFEAAGAPREFVELRGDHNSGFLRSQPGYQRSLHAFIRKYVDIQPDAGTLKI